MKAQPLGGIRLMESMAPNSPNMSDRSSSPTNFDKWPTHRVVLQTGKTKKDTLKGGLKKFKIYFKISFFLGIPIPFRYIEPCLKAGQ